MRLFRNIPDSDDSMSQSLQDQLLGAGLITKERANKVKKQKHAARQKGKKKPELSESKKLAMQAAARDAERARELNRQRDEAFNKKDLAGQVRQLIHENKVDRREAEIAYKFTLDSKIRQVMVTPLQQEKVVSGQLCVVKAKERFELVPKKIAEQIEKRIPGTMVLQNQHQKEIEDPDDPYADFKVPDDLVW